MRSPEGRNNHPHWPRYLFSVNNFSFLSEVDFPSERYYRISGWEKRQADTIIAWGRTAKKNLPILSALAGGKTTA